MSIDNNVNVNSVISNSMIQIAPLPTPLSVENILSDYRNTNKSNENSERMEDENA